MFRYIVFFLPLLWILFVRYGYLLPTFIRALGIHSHVMAKKSIMTAAIVQAFLLVWLLLNYRQGMIREGLESGTFDSSQETEVLFFTLSWCPHCVDAKPEWKIVKDQLDGKEMKGSTLRFREIVCDNSEDSSINKLIEKHHVTMFPSIHLVKPDGTDTEFDEGKITRSSLKMWIQSSL